MGYVLWETIRTKMKAELGCNDTSFSGVDLATALRDVQAAFTEKAARYVFFPSCDKQLLPRGDGCPRLPMAAY